MPSMKFKVHHSNLTMKVKMRLYVALILLSASTDLCSGERYVGCEVRGGGDSIRCAKIPGCYWEPNPASSRPTSDGKCLGTPTDTNGDVPATNYYRETREFFGTASTDLEYYDYDPWTGRDYFVKRKRMQYKIAIYLHEPLSSASGYQVETNPFNLRIFSERDSYMHSNQGEGFIDIASADVFTGFESGGDLLLQYWDIDLTGNIIRGELIDTHVQESAAWNLLWASDLYMESIGYPMVMPYPIGVGATMEGTATSQEIQLAIAGQSSNTYIRFNTNIIAHAK